MLNEEELIVRREGSIDLADIEEAVGGVGIAVDLVVLRIVGKGNVRLALRQRGHSPVRHQRQQTGCGQCCL